MRSHCRDVICYEKLICYFNICDICIAYKHIDEKKVRYAMNCCEKYIIDSGVYYVPTEICPLGWNAKALMDYAMRS